MDNRGEGNIRHGARLGYIAEGDSAVGTGHRRRTPGSVWCHWQSYVPKQ